MEMLPERMIIKPVSRPIYTNGEDLMGSQSGIRAKRKRERATVRFSLSIVLSETTPGYDL